MTLREKQTKFFNMIALLVLKAWELGTPICPLEWQRSAQQQAINVARGASKVKYSKHQDGLAMDFCFLADLQDDGKLNYQPDKYREIGEYWESLGGKWGGRFGDDPRTIGIEGWDAGHFEYVD